MRAILRPLRDKQETETVELLSRTGNGRVKVRLPKGATFAVDRFRLFAEHERSRRLTNAEIDALPWAGAGNDPALQATAALSPPWDRKDT